MNKTFCCMFIICAGLFCFTHAEKMSDTAGSTKNKNDKHFNYSEYTYEMQKALESSPWDQTNPINLLFVLMIRAYQKIFSSQEGSICQFRPSCSHYGVLSIKEYGPLQGILMTSDRLLRCNNFTSGKYQMTHDGLHHKDLPKDHVLW